MFYVFPTQLHRTVHRNQSDWTVFYERDTDFTWIELKATYYPG